MADFAWLEHKFDDRLTNSLGTSMYILDSIIQFIFLMPLLGNELSLDLYKCAM